MYTRNTPVQTPNRTARSEKVELFRRLYQNGRLNEILIPRDADVSTLVDAVFADRRRY